MNIENTIQRIREVAEGWGESLEPPASSSDIAEFKEKILLMCGGELPEEYFEFLKKLNGLEFNGLIIYGTKNSQTDPDGSPLDLIEMNEIMQDCSDVSRKEVVFIGEDSTGLLVYDLKQQEFQFRDRVGFDRTQSFSSFKDMVEAETAKVM